MLFWSFLRELSLKLKLAKSIKTTSLEIKYDIDIV